MKAHQLGIFFTVIALLIFLILDYKTSQVKAVIDEKNKMDLCLSSGIDDGVNTLAESFDKRDLITSREDVMNSFFTSLFASLDMVSDPVAQLNLRLYIPVILLTDSDGLYVFFHDEYNVSGITSIAMRWSEKYPYAYEDECFVYNFTMNDIVQIYDKNHIVTNLSQEPYLEVDYHDFQTEDAYQNFRHTYPNHFLLSDEQFYLVRKEVMIKQINDQMAYYINEHNSIAAQQGISYNFSLPVIDESELLRSIETPGMIVVFQGYPLRSLGETYNRVEIAGAQITKEGVYYMEQKGWYKLYHKSTCSECGSNPNIDVNNVFYNISDCAKEGAYACEKCCPEGVLVPDYYIH